MTLPRRPLRDCRCTPPAPKHPLSATTLRPLAQVCAVGALHPERGVPGELCHVGHQRQRPAQVRVHAAAGRWGQLVKGSSGRGGSALCSPPARLPWEGEGGGRGAAQRGWHAALARSPACVALLLASSNACPARLPLRPPTQDNAEMALLWLLKVPPPAASGARPAASRAAPRGPAAGCAVPPSLPLRRPARRSRRAHPRPTRRPCRPPPSPSHTIHPLPRPPRPPLPLQRSPLTRSLVLGWRVDMHFLLYAFVALCLSVAWDQVRGRAAGWDAASRRRWARAPRRRRAAARPGGPRRGCPIGGV